MLIKYRYHHRKIFYGGVKSVCLPVPCNYLKELQNILCLFFSAFFVTGTPFLFFKYFRFFCKLNTGNVLSAGNDFLLSFRVNGNILYLMKNLSQEVGFI